MNSLNEQKRIFGLDVMRTTAILMVLFSHLFLILPINSGIIGQLAPLVGFMGVEIFFVLSGFLIGKILYTMLVIDTKWSSKDFFVFLKRRWLRTFPNYFLVLLIAIFIAIAFGYSSEQSWKYFFFIQNLNQPMLPFFPESWSLSIEEFAYILLPFSLWMVFRYLRIKNKSLLFLLVVVGLIGSFIGTKCWYYYTTSNITLIEWNIALKAVVLYRLDSIFIGVLFSWLYFEYSKWWREFKWIWLALGLLLMGLLFIGVGFLAIHIETYPFFWKVLYLPITSLALALLLPLLSEWNDEINFIGKPITRISKISYSIYLLHYSVLFQLMRYFFNPVLLTKFELLAYSVCYLILTLGISSLLYRFYEKPFMNLRHKN